MPGVRWPWQTRGAWTRTSGDLLINDPVQLVWVGSDGGGLAVPIGPNGPWPGGSHGAARPVVTRATALITGPLTAAPARVVDSADPGRVLPAPRWVTDPMLTRPDARYPVPYPATRVLPRALFWSSWIRSAIWWGTGAVIVAVDATGQPVPGTLRLVDPGALSIVTDYAGNPVWRLSGNGEVPDLDFGRDGLVDVGGMVYRSLVLRNPHSPVGPDGMSAGVFGMHPEVFGLARQIDTYASGTFRSGIPAGYLKTTQPNMSKESADELKATWLAAHGGDRRSIAVLNAQTDFTPLNLSPVDAALGEVKRLNIADVAFAFGIDPMTLGAGLNNSATYSNLRDAWNNHSDFGLAPWIAAFEDVLSALLPGTQTIAVDMDAFANDTPAERYAAYKTGINAGILTVDEARALEGLPPIVPPPAVLQAVPPAQKDIVA
jgi:hypothetical protein